MRILKTLLTNLHSRIHICEYCGNPDFYGIGRWLSVAAGCEVTQPVVLSNALLCKISLELTSGNF